MAFPRFSISRFASICVFLIFSTSTCISWTALFNSLPFWFCFLQNSGTWLLHIVSSGKTCFSLSKGCFRNQSHCLLLQKSGARCIKNAQNTANISAFKQSPAPITKRFASLFKGCGFQRQGLWPRLRKARNLLRFWRVNRCPKGGKRGLFPCKKPPSSGQTVSKTLLLHRDLCH